MLLCRRTRTLECRPVAEDIPAGAMDFQTDRCRRARTVTITAPDRAVLSYVADAATALPPPSAETLHLRFAREGPAAVQADDPCRMPSGHRLPEAGDGKGTSGAPSLRDSEML